MVNGSEKTRVQGLRPYKREFLAKKSHYTKLRCYKIVLSRAEAQRRKEEREE